MINVENTHVLIKFDHSKDSTYTHITQQERGDTLEETKQRGRPKMCRGTKQRKQDFNSKLKAYSTTALDNVIKIAESSFSAETKLKANMFLIEKAVGKNFSLLEQDNETRQNNNLNINLNIIKPKHNIDVKQIETQIEQVEQEHTIDDDEEWGADTYNPMKVTNTE